MAPRFLLLVVDCFVDVVEADSECGCEPEFEFVRRGFGFVKPPVRETDRP